MKNNKRKTFIYNFFVFLGLILIMYFIIFRKVNIKDILESLKDVNLVFIVLTFIATFLYISLETVNVGRILNSFGYNKKPLTYLKYTMIGYFFSAITPSSSGGQPMQVYYMTKDDVDISHSTFALLVQLSAYQFSVVLIALVSLIFSFSYVKGLNAIIVFLFIIGFIINFMLFLIYTLLIFKNSFIKKISNFCIKLLKKINIKNIDKIETKINEKIDIFHESSNYIKKNKKIIINTVITCILQVLINYIGPYLIYKSFGSSENSLWLFISMQAILFICVSFVPIPGSVGASEAGFLGIYQFLFPESYLNSAMLLSRGVSFYLFVLITGIVVIINNYKIMKNKNRS